MDEDPSDETNKTGDLSHLVSDMLSAGVVKPSDKLKASLTKKAGQITDSDRERITEMLKGLEKYKDTENTHESDSKHHLEVSNSDKDVKSKQMQFKSPKSGGLLDFIDAEMSGSNVVQSSPKLNASPKSPKEIIVRPAATLNNKTNLKALSSAFQNLNVGSDKTDVSKVTSSPEEKQGDEDSEGSIHDDDDSTGKKRRRRRSRKKRQEQSQENASTVNVTVEVQPNLVYDITEEEKEVGIGTKRMSQFCPKTGKQGSYSQLLKTMGKGDAPHKTQSSDYACKSPKGRKRDFHGGEMIQVAMACDMDGKARRDVIIGHVEELHGKKTKDKKKKDKGSASEGDGSKTGSRKSSVDRQEHQKGKGKQHQKHKGESISPQQRDKKVKSPKQSEKGSVKREKEVLRTEHQNRHEGGFADEDSQLEPDYMTTASVKVRKQEHKYIIGHQRKHLQDIFNITGVSIDVPPININSEAILLSGLKSQLGPAVALMFSKSQQAQLEASNFISAPRDLLFLQGKGHQNFQGHQSHLGFQSSKGHQIMKSQGQGQYENKVVKRGQNLHQAPPPVGRQHSSNSQSSSTDELQLDTQEVKGRNLNQNANRGQYDTSSSNRGQSTRPYGNMGQINLEGQPSYHQQPYVHPNRQQQQYRGQGQGHGVRNHSQELGQTGRRDYREEQAGQSPGIRSQGKRQRTKKAMFADYISHEDLSAGLKRGILIQGPVRINPKNYEEAYVPHPDGLSDIFICGLKDRNRALNGDIVAVAIYEEGEWKVTKDELENLAESHKANVAGDDASESDSDIVIESEETIELVTNETKSGNQSTSTATEKEQIQNQDSQSKKYVKRDSPMKRFVCLRDVMTTGSKTEKKLFGSDRSASAKKILIRTGKVVAIVEKKHSRAGTGYLKPFQERCTDKALFCPNDHRLPRIVINIRDCPEGFLERYDDFSRTLFVARITEWKKDAAFADGLLAKSLGEAGEIEPETEGMLIENGIDFDEFPQEVMDCLPKESPWCIPASELDNRRDFRSSCVFTIDPKTARDLDDALSCEDLGNGRYKVGVHIADVSYFVKENNSLDIMAGLRATSVYLVQKVIPMLPRLLCEQLCSLNPDVDRLTFSVEWIMTEEGVIEEEWFGRSVIKSCVKLAYEHAQGFIEKPDKEWLPEELPPISKPYTVEDIKTRVLNFHKIAQNLRKSRLDSGSLRLDQVKLQYSLNMDTMMPNGCFVYEQKDSNRLVEEFMLLANMAVAHRINATYPDHAVLRRHPEPQQKMLENLKDQCSALGIQLDITSAGSLQKSMRNYYGNDENSKARLQVLTVLCAKPMQNAKYFCTGCIDDEALYHHYALNVPLYTHFTSPIRRYPDILVHRLLGASLGYCDPPSKAPTQIHKTAEHCNDKKTAAKRVGDLSGELFFAVFVKTVGPLEENGMVMAVFDKSFDVFILKLGVSKRVYCDKLPLREKSFKKERKVPSLKLIWKAEEGKPEVTQEISIFSVVDCVLQQGDLPLQWVVTIKRPSATVFFPEPTS